MIYKAQQLSAKVGQKDLFTQLSFQVQGGQLVGLLGPSGAGKTTLLNILGLLVKPSSGQLFLDQTELTKFNDHQRELFWKKQAAFLYQDAGIIDEESLLYNVALTRSKSAQAKALKYLKQVGLNQAAKSQAALLSGGEKRRLGVARLLYKKSPIIFADEPTASLDRENRQLIFGLLKQQADRGALVFISTHDEALANACQQKIYLTEEADHA